MVLTLFSTQYIYYNTVGNTTSYLVSSSQGYTSLSCRFQHSVYSTARPPNSYTSGARQIEDDPSATTSSHHRTPARACIITGAISGEVPETVELILDPSNGQTRLAAGLSRADSQEALSTSVLRRSE